MRRKYTNNLLNSIFCITAIIILAIDQITKHMVRVNVILNSSIEVVPNLFYITYVKNSGGAFGLFQDSTNIFIVASFIAIILIIILKIKLNLRTLLFNISLGFVLGGALGNQIDRLLIGEVTDFLHLVNFAVFNIADSFINIGFFLIILIIIRMYFKKDGKRELEKKRTNNR